MDILLRHRHKKSTDPSDTSHEERLAYLCMLERDQRLSASKTVCSVCTTAHTTSLFSLTGLSKIASIRECRGSEGRLWVCLHRVWNYALVRHATRPPVLLTSRPGTQCNCLNQELFLGNWCLTVQYPVLKVPKKSKFAWSAIRKALTALHDVRVCPHLRPSEQSVVESFHFGCLKRQKSQSPLDRCGCKWRHVPRCRSCRTSVYFEVCESTDGGSMLNMLVYRHIGRSEKGIRDPEWIAQKVVPEELGDLDQSWTKSSMKGVKLVGCLR